MGVSRNAIPQLENAPKSHYHTRHLTSCVIGGSGNATRCDTEHQNTVVIMCLLYALKINA